MVMVRDELMYCDKSVSEAFYLHKNSSLYFFFIIVWYGILDNGIAPFYGFLYVNDIQLGPWKIYQKKAGR